MENKKRLWKLRYWIIAGYAIPVAALLTASGLTMSQVNRVNIASKDLTLTNQNNDRLGRTAVEVQVMSRATRGYMLAQDNESRLAYEDAYRRYGELMEELDESIQLDQQRQNLAELKDKVEELQAINRNLIQLVGNGQVELAIQTWRDNAGNEQAQYISNLLDTMQTLEHQILEDSRANEAQALTSLQNSMLGVAGFSLIASVSIGIWVIYKTASQMNSSASNIASSTAEIAASIEQQEKIATQQAASVNETTTTIDELGASSRQSAEQAEAAAAGAQQALNLAEGGTTAVERTLQGMEILRQKVGAIAEQILRLSEQTSQIGSISGLVSDLANQTNMLALNAAVEAVRAGEHGKGFTVVSGEIRKLADQSKKSAEKINALVSDIQNAINSTVMVTDEGTKTVEESVSIANQTANAFAGVTDAMNNVVLNSQQISLNVQQQAVAIQQVVDAMNGLNVAAKETASGISQIKVGTQSLNNAATELKVLV
ncbi:MAG: methyl-accepting chemotaxis protein [Leptolyngbyaceae bacterium]|nr:methyl-accepting chemotaxis protein [Leptolyngbyaceae bacterium]